MPRFFIHPSEIKDRTLTLTGNDASHISYALRMAVGEEITVSDGVGGVYRCRLAYMDGKEVRAEIVETLPPDTELPVKVHLYQGYPKGDKLDFILQKAVELGAVSVTPFDSERCVKRPKAEKLAHIKTRQEKIVREAAGQCGRAILPTVGDPLSFEKMIREAASYPLCLFCYEGEGTESLRTLCLSHPEAKEIAVVVGSEGGFSVEEAEMAREAGLCLTNLGKRILRCETAPLYALSALSVIYEL